jgi:hypothetical protein
VSPEEHFETLVDLLAQIPGVTPPGSGRGFGANALRARGKIFAMLVRGRLVLKLPKERVDALARDGEGVRFDANRGTPMKEWFSIDPLSDLDWTAIAREALTFVSAT